MLQELKGIVYNTVIDARRKITPGEVERVVAGAAGIDRKSVRLVIKELVGEGELTYTYVHGTSFLEPSFDRPVRISQRIVIKPPDKNYEPQRGEVVVDLAGGVAFGNGAHPTTRLALEALEDTLRESSCLSLPSGSPSTALDVGTGTGILAIALARLGFQNVVGTDIDPCAISEARYNVSLNGLVDRIQITKAPAEELPTSFSVIMANLAYPTLKGFSPVLAAKLDKGGVLILSGFKTDVSADLAEAYAGHGLKLVREATEREWVGMTLCMKALDR